jgi:hypothetical protein
VILSVNYMARDTLKLARNNVPKLIESTYLLHRTELIHKLKRSLSWLYFSIDMWTSLAKGGFQAIVVHWVDEDTRDLKTALLSLKEFKGSHGGEAQAETFIEVVTEYGLEGNLSFFTSDNHRSNDIMLRHIAAHEKVNDFQPSIRRVRCFGHNLNIVSQAFLFGSIKNTGEDSQNENNAIYIAI